jgi:hypothetical protein
LKGLGQRCPKMEKYFEISILFSIRETEISSEEIYVVKYLG